MAVRGRGSSPAVTGAGQPDGGVEGSSVRARPALALAAVVPLLGVPAAHALPDRVPDRAPAHGARSATEPDVPADPPFSIDPEQVRAEAVDCVAVPDAPADVDAVVLVHGTGTSATRSTPGTTSCASPRRASPTAS